MEPADVSALAVLTEEQLVVVAGYVYDLVDHAKWKLDTVLYGVKTEHNHAAAMYRHQPGQFPRCDSASVDLRAVAAAVVEEWRVQDEYVSK